MSKKTVEVDEDGMCPTCHVFAEGSDDAQDDLRLAHNEIKNLKEKLSDSEDLAAGNICVYCWNEMKDDPTNAVELEALVREVVQLEDDKDFATKFPELWDDAFDIAAGSRYARAIGEAVKLGWRAAHKRMYGSQQPGGSFDVHYKNEVIKENEKLKAQLGGKDVSGSMAEDSGEEKVRDLGSGTDTII